MSEDLNIPAALDRPRIPLAPSHLTRVAKKEWRRIGRKAKQLT